MHRIRLDAAWERQAGEGTSLPARVHLPATIAELHGSRRLERVFHLPTGLTDDTRLRLCFGSLPPGTSVAVNGAAISAADSGSLVFELPASVLQLDNRIGLQFSETLPDRESFAVGPAWLEIPPP